MGLFQHRVKFYAGILFIGSALVIFRTKTVRTKFGATEFLRNRLQSQFSLFLVEAEAWLHYNDDNDGDDDAGDVNNITVAATFTLPPPPLTSILLHSRFNFLQNFVPFPFKTDPGEISGFGSLVLLFRGRRSRAANGRFSPPTGLATHPSLATKIQNFYYLCSSQAFFVPAFDCSHLLECAFVCERGKESVCE